MALAKKVELRMWTVLWICTFAVNCNSQDPDNSSIYGPKRVKKILNNNSSYVEATTVTYFNSTMTANHNPHADNLLKEVNVVEKSEEIDRHIQRPSSPRPTVSNVTVAGSDVHVQESNYKNNFFQSDNNIPESFQNSFYFFLGLSTVAVVFIVVKVYRLRLSRAERKYGVQGDRTTQELTPLPISIEDGNSDDDDQTLFEVNRQQIRIL